MDPKDYLDSTSVIISSDGGSIKIAISSGSAISPISESVSLYSKQTEFNGRTNLLSMSSGRFSISDTNDISRDTVKFSGKPDKNSISSSDTLSKNKENSYKAYLKKQSQCEIAKGDTPTLHHQNKKIDVFSHPESNMEILSDSDSFENSSDGQYVIDGEDGLIRVNSDQTELSKFAQLSVTSFEETHRPALIEEMPSGSQFVPLDIVSPTSDLKLVCSSSRQTNFNPLILQEPSMRSATSVSAQSVVYNKTVQASMINAMKLGTLMRKSKSEDWSKYLDKRLDLNDPVEKVLRLNTPLYMMSIDAVRQKSSGHSFKQRIKHKITKQTGRANKQKRSQSKIKISKCGQCGREKACYFCHSCNRKHFYHHHHYHNNPRKKVPGGVQIQETNSEVGSQEICAKCKKLRGVDMLPAGTMKTDLDESIKQESYKGDAIQSGSNATSHTRRSLNSKQSFRYMKKVCSDFLHELSSTTDSFVTPPSSFSSSVYDFRSNSGTISGREIVSTSEQKNGSVKLLENVRTDKTSLNVESEDARMDTCSKSSSKELAFVEKSAKTHDTISYGKSVKDHKLLIKVSGASTKLKTQSLDAFFEAKPFPFTHKTQSEGIDSTVQLLEREKSSDCVKTNIITNETQKRFGMVSLSKKRFKIFKRIK